MTLNARPIQNTFPLPAIASLTTSTLAACSWAIMPDRAALWGVVMIIAPLAGIIALKHAQRTSGDSSVKLIENSLIAANGIIILSLLVSIFQQTMMISPGLADRITGIAMGAILFWTGNTLPKMAAQNPDTSCALRNKSRIERFAGWALLLAGTAYMASWATLPIEEAKRIAPLFGIVALILIGIRISISRSKSQSTK